MLIIVAIAIIGSIRIVICMLRGMSRIAMAEQMGGILDHLKGPWHQKNAEHNRNRWEIARQRLVTIALIHDVGKQANFEILFGGVFSYYARRRTCR